MEGSWIFCLWLMWSWLTLPSSHSPENNGLAVHLRLACCIRAASHQQHQNSLARQAEKNRPDCCMTATGSEKDTADKCINYSLNFVSQLTLHATFQVSQPGEDEQCRWLLICQRKKKTESEKIWGEGKMTNLWDNRFLFSLQKKRQNWPDNIVINKFPEIPVLITKHKVQVN